MGTLKRSFCTLLDCNCFRANDLTFDLDLNNSNIGDDGWKLLSQNAKKYPDKNSSETKEKSNTLQFKILNISMYEVTWFIHMDISHFQKKSSFDLLE